MQQFVYRRVAAVCFVLFFVVLAAFAQNSPALSAELRSKADAAVRELVSASGVPSASVAIVRDGRIAYSQAYGEGRIETRLAAKPEMRYAIGSISKQFTAAAI